MKKAKNTEEIKKRGVKKTGPSGIEIFRWLLRNTSNSHCSSILHVVMDTFQCFSLKSPTFFFSHRVQKFVLYTECLLCCLACREVGSRQRGYMYTGGQFIMMYGKNHHNVVKCLLLLLLSRFSHVRLCATP